MYGDVCRVALAMMGSLAPNFYMLQLCHESSIRSAGAPFHPTGAKRVASTQVREASVSSNCPHVSEISCCQTMVASGA